MKSLATLLLVTALAGARSGPEHRSFRPLAMGNAFVAVVDDKDALYYNPAGLNLINSLGNPAARPDKANYPRNRFNARIDLVGLAIPLTDALSLMRFYKDHRSSLADPDSLRSDETLYPDMIPLSRKPIRIGILHSSEVAVHNFGIAYWADARVAPYADDGLLLPQAGIQSMQIDAVFQIAGAASLFDPRLSIGAGYRFANRQEVHNFNVAASEFADQGGKKVIRAVKDSLQEKMANLNDLGSYGHGLDIGVLWQQSDGVRFGVAAQNLGMSLNGRQTTPEITIGLAVTPANLSRGGRLSRKVNFALDIEDLLDRDPAYMPLSKVNFGAEVEQDLSWVLDVRLAGGFKGGYWTAGGGISLFKTFHLEAVSWADEGGSYTGQMEERYYALNLALGF
jgi:hypothetical protein